MGSDETQKTSTLRCPECGGDTSVCRSKPTKSHERAVRIPFILWILFVLLVVALVSPWAQVRLGQPWAIYGSTIPSNPQPSISAPMPVVTASGIIDEPEASAEVLDDAYQAMRKHLGPWWSGLQVRLVFVDPSGTIQDSHTRGLIGNWYSVSATTMTSNSALIPADHAGLDYPAEALIEDQYPPPYYNQSRWELQYQTTRLNGAQSYWRQINAFNILGSIMILWVLIRITNWFLKRRGLRHMRRRKTVLLTHFASATLLVLLGWRLQANDHLIAFSGMNRVAPIASSTGEWMDGEQWIELIKDPHAGERMVEMMGPVASQAPTNHVLGYQYKRNVSTEFRQYTSDVFGYLPLISYSTQRYYAPDENAVAQPVDRPEGYMDGLKVHWPPTSEWLSISLGLKSALIGIVLVPSHIVLLGAVLWSLLRYSRMIARQLAYRTQKKRVKQNQCIFCAYPLSPEALAARSSTPGS